MAIERASATSACRASFVDASVRLDLRTHVAADSSALHDRQAPNDFENGFLVGSADGVAGHAARQARGLQPHRLKRVLDRIDSQLAEALYIQDLATLAVLSPRHFTTAFKRSVGIPPHRYILERRIKRAGGLLAVSRQSIADVAYQVGFSSQAHFTTMFRKLVGMTPGAFRTYIQTGRRGGAADDSEPFAAN